MPDEVDGKIAAATPSAPPSIWWDRLERIAKIFSLVAIPIVIPISLAFYSARIQTSSQKEAFDRDYVQLAVSILKDDKPDSTQNTALRTWAVDLLKSHSATKFPDDLQAGLKSGSISFPTNTTEPRPFIPDGPKADAFRLSLDITKFVSTKLLLRPKFEDFSSSGGRADLAFKMADSDFEAKTVAEFHKRFDTRIAKIIPVLEKGVYGLNTEPAKTICSNGMNLPSLAECGGEIAKEAAMKSPS
jgi:hypothetical protein